MSRCCEGRAISCCMDNCPEEKGHAEADTALLEACRELVDLVAAPPDAEELSWNAPQLRGLLGLFRNEARSVKSKLNERLNSTAQVAKGE